MNTEHQPEAQSIVTDQIKEPENKLLISTRVLDRLGFSEYWDEHGTWGSRTLTFSNGVRYAVIEQEEMDDDTEGYSFDGHHVDHHFYWYAGFCDKSQEGHDDLYFLHEMYYSIKNRYPDCLPEFIEKCKKNKMALFIKDL